jgi:opacity protein-like surface antigen
VKKIIAAALLSAPFAAGAADFTGLNVWVGGQYVDGEFEGRDFSDNSTFSIDDTDTVLTIGADYGFALSESTVLIVGMSWSDKADIADLSFNEGGEDLRFSVESDQSYMAYIAPGIKVGQSSLLYAKLSYSDADAKVTLKSITNGTSASLSESDKALGFGAGFRTHISDNAFLNIEVERIEHEYSYRNTVLDFNIDADTPVTRASVSVGMTF